MTFSLSCMETVIELKIVLITYCIHYPPIPCTFLFYLQAKTRALSLQKNVLVCVLEFKLRFEIQKMIRFRYQILFNLDKKHSFNCFLNAFNGYQTYFKQFFKDCFREILHIFSKKKKEKKP